MFGSRAQLAVLRGFTALAGSEPALRVVNRVWALSASTRATLRRRTVAWASAAGLATRADVAAVDLQLAHIEAACRAFAAELNGDVEPGESGGPR